MQHILFCTPLHPFLPKKHSHLSLKQALTTPLHRCRRFTHARSSRQRITKTCNPRPPALPSKRQTTSFTPTLLAASLNPVNKQQQSSTTNNALSQQRQPQWIHVTKIRAWILQQQPTLSDTLLLRDSSLPEESTTLSNATISSSQP